MAKGYWVMRVDVTDPEIYKAYLADLALWERRWTDADAAIQDGIAQARQREALGSYGREPDAHRDGR